MRPRRDVLSASAACSGEQGTRRTRSTRNTTGMRRSLPGAVRRRWCGRAFDGRAY